jgi:hypothetical protein
MAAEGVNECCSLECGGTSGSGSQDRQLTEWSLYPRGLGSVELLSEAPFSWESMTGKNHDCSNCALRDQCNGICQFARDADREAYD